MIYDSFVSFIFYLYQCSTASGLRATSGPRPFVTRSAKLFVHLLLQAHLFSLLRTIKDIVNLISSSHLATSTTHAIGFKTQP
jgi:hypothetical protein